MSDVLDELGAVGERIVQRVLAGKLSLRRIRAVLPELKRERRRRLREVREEHRTRVTVHLRDAVWGLDATHLGRDERGRSVQAEVVRELASTRTIEAAVGPPASATEVVAALQRARRARGTLPLVLVTDNGGPYVSELLASWLTANGVVHLKTLPHTPQHNAATEHGHAELKSDAGLGKGVRVSACEARARLERSRERIDARRPGASRGWRTAHQADADNPPYASRIDRGAFYAVTCAIEAAVEQCSSGRRRRRAEREAILNVLGRYPAISRTRGGVPVAGPFAEDDS